jgi:nitrogen PTS system EIIA component
MKILDFLEEDRILPDLKGNDKGSVLREMSVLLEKPCGASSAEEVFQILSERERLESTGIGEGIAIPHGRLKKLKSFLIAFGRSLKGVDFDSIDQKPTHLFFTVMAPENSAVDNLKILGRIVALLKDSAFKKRLMEATTRKEIFQIISEKDESY